MHLLLLHLCAVTGFTIKHRIVPNRIIRNHYNGNNDDKLRKIDEALNAEKIKMKQVEEEYYKADEKIAQTPTGSNTNSTTVISGAQDLYPPSPDQPLNTMTSNVPEAVKDAVNSLIKSQKTIEESDKSENVVIIPERSEGGEVVNVFPENKVISKNNSVTDLNSIVVNK